MDKGKLFVSSSLGLFYATHLHAETLKNRKHRSPCMSLGPGDRAGLVSARSAMNQPGGASDPLLLRVTRSAENVKSRAGPHVLQTELPLEHRPQTLPPGLFLLFSSLPQSCLNAHGVAWTLGRPDLTLRQAE